MEYIDKTKQISALSLNKMIVKDFDFCDKGGLKSGHGGKILHKDPHIYLLSPAAFENQAPNYQIKKLLDKEMTNKRIKFEEPNTTTRTYYNYDTKVQSSLYNEEEQSHSKATNAFKSDLLPL